MVNGMEERGDAIQDRILFQESRQRITFTEAYPHRGRFLEDLALFFAWLYLVGPYIKICTLPFMW